MKAYIVILTVVLCFWTSISLAQSHCTDCLSSKDSVVTSYWAVGLGMNIVDDSATPFGWDFIKIEETWNMVPYPSRFSVGRFSESGFGIETIATYNRYKEGKLVDGRTNPELREYFAIDGKLSYDLNKLVGETGWFDPYIHTGGGYSWIGAEGRVTANAGFGFNTWLNDKWGLNFNTMGKWGIKEGSTKQLQHSAGVVRRFGTEQELTKKGEAKLALLKEIAVADQRLKDSIIEVRKAEEEAKALAERLEREKEAAKLAAAEKSKLDAENNRKKQILDAVDALGNVYFDLNSSYLNTASKSILEQLSMLLTEHPSLQLRIASHTDSRGTDAYNAWLSARRAKRTLNYLIHLGIDPQRLGGEGHGEEMLTNHCEDKVYCKEEEHRANRRSEFKIISF